MGSDIVSSIASAITQMENANPALNNPGNIMDYDYYKSTGQFRLQQYSSPEEGQAALESLITKYVGQGLNLQDFFAKYAPAGHGNNDPVNYANFVSNQTGIPLDVPLNELTTAPNLPAPSAPFVAQGPTLDMLDTDATTQVADNASNASGTTSTSLSLFDFSNLANVGSGASDALSVSEGNAAQPSTSPLVWLGVGLAALLLMLVAKR
jgi:hypothetical protein